MRLVNAAGGRALVLCTSRANVERFAELLRRTDHEVLAQGDADVGRLSREFADDETSVLVGTRSFWAGIDAPGVSCVLVVIDRIPFPFPDEPLNAAAAERAGGGLEPFVTVDLPEAALVLAQGAVGSSAGATTGVVAVLDARLATRDYRTQLLAAMPPFRRSVDLEEACAFLRGGQRRSGRPPGAGSGAGTEGVRTGRRAGRLVDAGHGRRQGHDAVSGLWRRAGAAMPHRWGNPGLPPSRPGE